jgi:signal transduction histidine kinase
MIDAQEEERRRIARELHDQVGQILTALQLQLGSVAKRGAIEDAAASLMLAREFADEALRHTRDLSASLHPHLLDDLGLEPALNWLVDRFIRPLVPDVELRCRLQPPRGSQQAELVAFRVVQEALTNAARHSQATRIGVILEVEVGTLSIEVIDDGVGFEGGAAGVEAKRGTSLGLAAMHDRVAELGGDLEMHSTPGIGTRIRATLPWAKERVDA